MKRVVSSIAVKSYQGFSRFMPSKIVQGHLQAPDTRTSTSLVTVTMETRASRTMLEYVLFFDSILYDLLRGHVDLWGFEADF